MFVASECHIPVRAALRLTSPSLARCCKGAWGSQNGPDRCQARPLCRLPLLVLSSPAKIVSWGRQAIRTQAGGNVERDELLLVGCQSRCIPLHFDVKLEKADYVAARRTPDHIPLVSQVQSTTIRGAIACERSSEREREGERELSLIHI